MAVVSVNERYQQRDSSMSDDQRRQVRVFHVHVDSMDDGPEAARTATGVPQVGDQHPTDPYVRAVRVEPEMIDGDPFHYDVRVEYSTRPLRDRRDLSMGPEFENPLLRPAQIHCGFLSSQREIARAYGVKIRRSDETSTLTLPANPEDQKRTVPILNTAGNGFDPRELQDISRPMIRFVRNESADTFDFSLAIEYIDAVNTDDFWGGLPGQVKVANISAVRMFECNLFFWRVTYEFHYRREGWREVLNNEDLEARPEPGAKPVTIMDDKGCPVRKPKQLDADGCELVPGSTEYVIDIAKYREMPFSTLSLPAL